MSRRGVLRAVVALIAPMPVLGLSSAALAAPPVATGWRDSGLTPLQVLGVYVGLPIALFVVLSVLFVLLPQWASGSRYRPGLMWTVEPVWFDGPEDERESVAIAEPSQSGGGASASW